MYFTNLPFLTSSRTFAVHRSEDGDEGGEKVVSSTTAWSHSSDLLNYALSTNDSELIALLSQARDLIQADCRKAIDNRRQVSITSLLTNKMLDMTTGKILCFYFH